MRIPCRERAAAWAALMLMWPLVGSPARAQLDWDSPTTAACFERWISEAERRLNAYSGDSYFNDVKPWRINQYGLVLGVNGRSAFEPDDWWSVYRGNKYHRMWDKYPYDPVTGWGNANWDGAEVPALRRYVRACVAESGGGGSLLPASGSRPPGVYVWVFTTATPKTVSVADGAWPSGNAAWITVAGPFPDHPSAWRVACSYHAQPAYSAPAIVGGAIDCSALGAAAGVAPGGRTVAGTYSGGDNTFGKVLLTGDPERWSGSYTATYDRSQPGRLGISRDPSSGRYTGWWEEPAVGRSGVLEGISFADDGSIRATWRVTQPGRQGSRTLRSGSGPVTLRRLSYEAPGGATAPGGGIAAGGYQGGPNEFGTVALTGEDGYWSGTYTATYDRSKLGTVRISRDPASGRYSGEWGEPAVGRRGVFDRIEVTADGSIRATWRVIEAGRQGSRTLHTGSGTVTLRRLD